MRMDAPLRNAGGERKRVVRNGGPSNDLVFSSYQDGNEEVFPRILELYVREGSLVADVTFGAGVFWKSVDPSRNAENGGAA